MKYSLQSLVEEYTRASHHKPTQLTPATYTPSAYMPTRYTSSSYTPSHYTSSLYAPKQSSSRYSSVSSLTPALRTAPNYTPTRRSLKAGRTVHFTNDVIFQDNIRHGDLPLVGRFLRARKVKVNNAFPSGMAAIHEAVLTGNLDCVKLLVTYGADVHLRDEDGWTALHMACSDGYPEIAKYLLSLGASKQAETLTGERPIDLIDPECTELVKLFEVGCV